MDPLARRLLEGSLKSGQTVTVDVASENGRAVAHESRHGALSFQTA
jgi:hypothetical protein